MSKLQVVINHLVWMLGNELRSSARGEHALNCSAVSPSLCSFHVRKYENILSEHRGRSIFGLQMGKQIFCYNELIKDRS